MNKTTSHLFRIILCLLLLNACAPKQRRIFNDSRDGKTYPIVQLGEQVWMAKKLAFASDSSWTYNDDLNDSEENGRLYHWQDACQVCPEGWRLSSEEDWQQLESFLGMPEVELAKKSQGD